MTPMEQHAATAADVLDATCELAPTIAARAAEIEAARRLLRTCSTTCAGSAASGCCVPALTVGWELNCPPRCGSSSLSLGSTRRWRGR
jgi:hypothetical protein